MKKLLTGIFAALFLSLSVLAQSFTTTVYEKEGGIAIVNATGKRQIGFIIKGKSVSFEKNPSGSLVVDNEGVRLVFAFIKKSEFLKVASNKTDEGILEEYRNWDIAGTEEDLKSKIEVDVKLREPLLISDIRKNESLSTVPSVYWSFIAPGFENTKRSSFQATLIDDLILLVATTYPSTEKEEAVQRYFKDMFVTLMIMDAKATAKPKPTSKKKSTKAKKN